MHTVKEFNELGLELEESLYLRFVPIALKVLYSRDEVPEGCYIPSRDRNEHPALCQAFAQVRRNKRSMARCSGRTTGACGLSWLLSWER